MPAACTACGRPSAASPPIIEALPERIISGQITAVSGPLARTIDDVRLGLAAMSQPDARDPWWVPAPLEGPARAKRAAMCLRPDGLAITADVEAAVRDAGKRLKRAGWIVEEDREHAGAARSRRPCRPRSGSATAIRACSTLPSARAIPVRWPACAARRTSWSDFENGGLSRALVRRSTFVRDWELFLQDLCRGADADVRRTAVPRPSRPAGPGSVRSRLGGADAADRHPVHGPAGAVSVATGLVGRAPTGVQVVAGRYREDLCLLAGEAIEAGGTPPMPCDPVTA